MSSRLNIPIFLVTCSHVLLRVGLAHVFLDCPIVQGNFQGLSDCSHCMFFGQLVAEFNCSHWKFFTSFTLEFPWLQLVAVSCGLCTCEKSPIVLQLKLLTHLRKCECGVQL